MADDPKPPLVTTTTFRVGRRRCPGFGTGAQFLPHATGSSGRGRENRLQPDQRYGKTKTLFGF